jgi:hypothetical protein
MQEAFLDQLVLGLVRQCTIASCINNAIMDVEVRDTYAQIEGERRSS